MNASMISQSVLSANPTTTSLSGTTNVTEVVIEIISRAASGRTWIIIPTIVTTKIPAKRQAGTLNPVGGGITKKQSTINTRAAALINLRVSMVLPLSQKSVFLKLCGSAALILTNIGLAKCNELPDIVLLIQLPYELDDFLLLVFGHEGSSQVNEFPF